MKFGFKSDANAKAMSGGVKWFAFAIVTLVAIYGDVMFLQLMLPAFPDNWIMRGLACIGAVATALSVILLYIGKNRWFRPGGQLIWAYWFTAIEFVILALNCIVAFAFHQSPNLDWILQIWFYCCPVTPLISAGGWVLINHFDRDNQEMHEDMELEDSQRAAMRAYKFAEHEAHMQILHKTLEQKTAYVNRWIDSQAGQSGIEEAASGFGRQVLSGLAGYPVIPALKPPTVEGTAQHAVAHLSKYADTQQEAQRMANAEKAQFEAIRHGFPTRQDVQNGAPSIFADHPALPFDVKNWIEAYQASGTDMAFVDWVEHVQATRPGNLAQSVLDERMYDANDMKRYTAESVDRVADYYAKEMEKMKAAFEKRLSDPLAQAPIDNSPSGQNGHGH